ADCGDDKRDASSAGKTRRRPKIPLPVEQPQPLPIPIANDQPLTEKTTIRLSGEDVEVHVNDLEVIDKLGQGQYGVVEKVRHKNTNCLFALKRVRHSFDTKENERHIREINVQQRTTNCPYAVFFYGALFREGDLMILMELMDLSLDRMYKTAHLADVNKPIPGNVLKHVAYSVLSALDYMYQIKIIHRDVKPSNILTNRRGQFKMCDFGIAGQLVNSFARSEIGSQQYLAPERIDVKRDGSRGYTSVSDVWSFGITMVELANGKYPYEHWKTPFQQINDILNGPTPKLRDDDPRFDPELRDFVGKCLVKNPSERWRFNQLLKHSFLSGCDRPETLESMQEETAVFVKLILDVMEAKKAQQYSG
ncbi:hypothetical protein BOX15_Mlig002141g2, partial [Macrostomum lignano]